MRIACTATVSLAAIATLCIAAASAHEMGVPAAGAAAANCPAPKPAASPTRHKARPHCVDRRRFAARSAPVRRAYAQETGRWTHRRGPDDFGVAPSQAFVYGREFERDHRGFSPQWYAQRNQGPVLGVTPTRPPRPPEPDHRPAMVQGDRFAGSMQFERRQSESRGHVEGERDGHAFAWSWSSGGQADGGRCGPCSAPHPDGGHWRYNQGGGYEVYRYAGRDENGFLVWPGKPR